MTVSSSVLSLLPSAKKRVTRQKYIQQQSPKHNVCEEASLQVMSAPAQSLAVDREVFGDPEDRIRQTTTLSGAKLLVKPPSCTTYSYSCVELQPRADAVACIDMTSREHKITIPVCTVLKTIPIKKLLLPHL